MFIKGMLYYKKEKYKYGLSFLRWFNIQCDDSQKYKS